MTRVLTYSNQQSNLFVRMSLVAAISLCSGTIYAQKGNGAPEPVSVIPQIAAPAWSELTNEQQLALLPLQKAWPELSDGQRRKWIAVVKNFNKLAEQDQVKVQDRMENWAALKPVERERARENFASAKLAPPGSKSGSWEEYQSLSQEERDRLAGQAIAKKPRAAKLNKAPVIAPPGPEPIAPGNYPIHPARGELRLLLSPSTLLPLQNRR